MSNQNICKFPQPSLSLPLSVFCFVLESEPEKMRSSTPVSSHRVLLFTHGEGEVTVAGERRSLSAGLLLFVFRGESFCVTGEAVTYMYISFEGGRAEELFRRFDVRHGRRAFEGMDGLVPLWGESLSRASEETVDLASESILLYTFSRLFGNGAEGNRLVSRIIAMTEERFVDSSCSISDIAEVLCYHPKYLSHLFKKEMGVSYSEYLRSLRVKYAVSLFDQGIESVKNVALLSGFSDPLYFSTVFKGRLGVSPTEYKKERKRG